MGANPDLPHPHHQSRLVHGREATYTTLPPQPWNPWGGAPRGEEGNLAAHPLRQGWGNWYCWKPSYIPEQLRFRSGGGGSGSSTPPLLRLRQQGGSQPHLSFTSILIRSDRTWGPSSHTGGGRKEERQDGRARNPQPDPDEGDAILMPDIWGEVTLQPPPPSWNWSKTCHFGTPP